MQAGRRLQLIPRGENLAAGKQREEIASDCSESNFGQTTTKILKSRCAFRPHGLSESNLDPFLTAKWIVDSKLSTMYTTHSTDFQTKFGFAKDSEGKDIFPTLWSRWHVPSEDKFPMDEVPWGRICAQFDWPDVTALGDGYANAYYRNALRHENMTWVWIKDISSCKCFPSCYQCTYRVAGLSPQFEFINKTCLATYKNTIDDCEYKIVGVGGGPMVYPTAITDMPCTKVLAAKDVQVPGGVIRALNLTGSSSTLDRSFLRASTMMFHLSVVLLLIRASTDF
ncbi:hypothetical protein GUITHDRAFT_104678 [Guillardia theta CCMP2712]|uniref:Uncharacterized protein n=1 Tax=Guillardia theta (strain CCMP2712) TaxID=905079 RepID=L1JN58_GUITC|nr:hypothetical protein GUITHDRAFT_104678 [Guillardia theta CCMP2712]EKX49714.1 hypothetical protein GUITHDRAFT_104678 [Guillardia theta CCMP2712]|eukprot:XP_005836694.1 hypothetical protein GUITHDRAFT_104678 [Guillardia theta CCMP2712]